MKRIKIWTLTDKSIDEIVEKHFEIITRPTNTIVNMAELMYMGKFGQQEEERTQVEPIIKTIKKTKGIPKKTIIYHKYVFLIHQIIKKSRKSKNGDISINTPIYYDILKDNIFTMLSVLNELGIINLSSTYDIGISARKMYLLDWNIACENIINEKVSLYIERYNQLWNNIKKKHDQKNIENLMKNMDKENCIPFINSYNRSLKKVKLLDEQSAYRYIDIKNDYVSEQSKHFYLSKIEDNKEEINEGIITIDKNGRIYHYFTNCPSILKPYFNFKFSLDISNSHPLLLSKLLFSYYKINNKIPNILYNYNINNISSLYNNDNNNNHNNKNNNIYHDPPNLYKLLKNNGLERYEYNGIPNDVLYYIMLVEKGLFWEKMMSLIEGKNRREIKETLFGEVFYGKRLNTRGYQYAPIFVKMFPNVWRMLRKIKKKDRTLLPNQLMKEESKLFHKILEECFMRKWDVISIHDCIVVINTNKNANLNIDDVRSVMENVYHENGLYPTIKVETYNELKNGI